MKETLDQISFELLEKNKTEDGIIYNVEIKVPTSIGWIERMKFIVDGSKARHAFQLNHIKNENNFVYFAGEVFLPTCALYHYYFSFEANHQFIYYKNKNKEDINTISKNEMWKTSVNFNVPNWAKGKIIYHIFVDRFARDNSISINNMKNRSIHSNWDDEPIIGPDENGLWNTDFYGGNLRGIINSLPYLKELGVDIIYLSPINLSQSNHRYDTSDYEEIDPYVGSKEDLKELCDKAHSMDMRVILDSVFNHTGNDSKYFNEYSNFDNIGAYQSVDSEYYEFYKKYNNDFCYWWGMRNLPVCDGNNKKWRDYIYGDKGIVEEYIKLGVDGLRLDVADELSDEFIEGIKKKLKSEKEDSYLLGEVWKNPMRMGRGYIESAKALDSVMNYPLMDALIRYYKYDDVHKLSDILNQIMVEYPSDTINSLMNFTSTHDISRIITIFGANNFSPYNEWAWDLNNKDYEYTKNFRLSEEELAKALKNYYSYLFTLIFMPGNLSLFYGDEVALEGMGNLSNRKTYPWNNFNRDVLKQTKEILSIRKKEAMLADADFEVIDINNKLLAFLREKDDEELRVFINKSDDTLLVRDLFIHDIDKMYNYRSDELSIMPYGGIALKRRK